MREMGGRRGGCVRSRSTEDSRRQLAPMSVQQFGLVTGGAIRLGLEASKSWLPCRHR
jgi:hypothetical protein